MNRAWMALCLASAAMTPSLALAQTTAPYTPPASLAADLKKHSHDVIPPMTEGQPVDTRTPEKADDKPVFPGQTRAPFHASGVSYKVEVLPIKLTRGGSIDVLPDGDILVAERAGVLRIFNQKTQTASDPITGLPTMKTVKGGGLITVIADPAFARTRRIYLCYDLDQAANGADGIAVARANLSADGKSLTDLKEIFRAAPAMTNKEGNGDKSGRMIVDKDGNLFIASGGRPSTPDHMLPQGLDNDIGKIVRITPDGAPAPGNPFIGKAGARPEIWSIGHRNPEGFAFDGQGRLWEIEMGPRGGDELNLIEPGKNYGWPLVAHGMNDDLKPLGKGETAKEGTEQPRYYWDPVIAPAGMAYYTSNLFPQLKGSFLIGSLRGEELDHMVVKGDKVVSEEPLLTELRARIRDVRVGPDGAIYIMTDDDTNLLKVTPK